MKNFIFCAVYEASCIKGVAYDNEVKFNQLLMDWNEDIKVALM